MRITLVSNCLDFASLLNDHADIRCGSSALHDPIPDAELFIWDHFPDLDLKALVANRPAAQHLVLTESKWLEFLTDVQGGAYILLKPANAFTLRAFIELAFKTWKTRCRGLAMCKSIIAAHYGIIWAHPTDHEGRFSFVLPYRLLADTDGQLNLASDGVQGAVRRMPLKWVC